ncbi:MAG: tetratricopeptide repeat protein [Terriglobales bacterium]
MPSLIAMCEDSDGCSDWGFKGNQGIGLWADGANADLTITHLDANSIRIHRVDSKGTGAGITADYTGAISNYWIEGDVTASWPGHQQGVTHTKWHGMIFPSQAETQNSAKAYEASVSHATAWTICQDFGDRCSVDKPPIDTLWVLAGRNGTMRLLPDTSAQIFLYVNDLPDHQILVRRFDKTGIVQAATILYSGVWQNGRLKGTFTAMWPGHMNSPMSGKWVALPASTHCLTDYDIQTAEWTGIMANMREDKSASLVCYQIAANKGDGDAQTMVGMYYYAGWGTTIDYKKSFYWLKQAAEQDNPDALTALSVYFQQGKAAAVNLLLAHYFADRAEFHKREASLFQTVVNGSGKGKMAALDMLGNIAASLIFGEQDKTQQLAARIGHEEAVLAHMDDGMSRVESEERVYNDDRMQGAKDALTNGDPCSMDRNSSYAPTLENQQNRYREMQAHERAYTRCEAGAQAREAAYAAAAADYLKCVHNYVDSNAVEQHCKYFQ